MTVQSKRVQMTNEVRQAVLAQLDKGTFYGGEQAFQFERELGAYLGVRHVLTVNSGTSALLVAAVALDIGPGAEVLIPANVYPSSAEVTAFLGATPVFCDIDESTATMTAETAARRLTPRTKALIVTHMYGHPADMDPLVEFARAHNLRTIEICAHALGAGYRGRKAGSLCDIGMLSLGSKNISVCTTGGAITTNSYELYQACAAVSRHGWPRKPIDESFFEKIQFNESPNAGMFPLERDSVRPGLNLQLDEIPCTIGRIHLRQLDEWNARRRQVAALYNRLIAESDLPVRTPVVQPWAEHAFLHYVVRVPRRDALMTHLVDAGIEALIHYPILIPEMRYYAQHFPTPSDAHPVASRVVKEILTLPIHPWITDREVQYVVDQMVKFYRAHPV
ncbi:MAG: DegT/DnrJ/EryC1/StrS family aminotransferase [Armatimonadetes bacterium]|nr:DegT/DnrJ/EryC1/StrS family aminotransferase [Armatimonadota bacterium]